MEVLGEPLSGELGDELEGAGFFEEVCRPGDDLEVMLAAEAPGCVLVQFEHYVIAAADDQ